MSLLGREGRSERRVELMSRAKEWSSRRGTVRCARASTGRWVYTRGEGSEVFKLSGIMLWAGCMHRARWESGALALSRDGKDLQRRAETGLMDVGEEMTPRAAMRLLGGRSTESGERHDSAARIRLGVGWEQLVTHLCTWRQWTSILLRRPLVGVNRSAPYDRIGNIEQ